VCSSRELERPRWGVRGALIFCCVCSLGSSRSRRGRGLSLADGVVGWGTREAVVGSGFAFDGRVSLHIEYRVG
jgi:hypothetical protein